MEKITQCLIFPELFTKPIHLKFDEPHSSSDGGALLLKAADQKLQLTSSLAACLVDDRQAAKVKHSIEDLLRQRIYGLASGYADVNDAARLASMASTVITIGDESADPKALPERAAKSPSAGNARKFSARRAPTCVGPVCRTWIAAVGRAIEVTWLPSWLTVWPAAVAPSPKFQA